MSSIDGVINKASPKLINCANKPANIWPEICKYNPIKLQLLQQIIIRLVFFYNFNLFGFGGVWRSYSPRNKQTLTRIYIQDIQNHFNFDELNIPLTDIAINGLIVVLKNIFPFKNVPPNFCFDVCLVGRLQLSVRYVTGLHPVHCTLYSSCT